MKKYISFFALGLLTLSNISLAQNADIGGISAKFCSGNENLQTLELIADHDIEYEICVNFYNTNNSDVLIDYSFVDGILTADNDQNKACTINDMEAFGQYVSQQDSQIIIPANGTIQTNATITFPKGVNGIRNGCLVYSIADNSNESLSDSNETSESMLKIQVRKATFIDAIVGGDIVRDVNVEGTSYSSNKGILDLYIIINNSGNVIEEATFDGNIHNIFGFNKNISGTRSIEPESSNTLDVTINNIPRYRLFYTIDGTINYTTDKVTTNYILTNNIPSPNPIVIHKVVVIFPWTILFILIGIFALTSVIIYLSKHLKFQK